MEEDNQRLRPSRRLVWRSRNTLDLGARSKTRKRRDYTAGLVEQITLAHLEVSLQLIARGELSSHGHTAESGHKVKHGTTIKLQGL